MEMYINSFEPETRCGFLVSSQMKKLWNIQLNMAAELLDLCRRHNLKIWASDGSALGAVRHKGYIPWDDDMDFMMMRDDYDRLVKIAPVEISSPFHFQSAYNEPGYYRGHSQMRYEGTTMILPEEAHYGVTFDQSVFIDIFVADGVPADPAGLDALLKTRSNILHYLTCRHNPAYLRHSFNYYAGYNKARQALGEMAQWDDHKLYAHLEQLFRETPVAGSHRMSPLMFTSLKSLYADPAWFDEIIWVPYEQTTLPIPARFDEYLTSRYGDYMKPVRGGCLHGGVILDTERPYTEYLTRMRYSEARLTAHFVKSLVKGTLRKVLH